YPVYYPVPYPAPYPSYPAPYPYGNQYPQYPPTYQNQYPPAYQNQDPSYSNPYPQEYQQQSTVNITPAVTGGVSFAIQPSTAEVLVGGQSYGEVGSFSPRAEQPLALAPGRHRVEIRQAGYRDVAFDVDIIAGKVLPYQGTLQAN